MNGLLRVSQLLTPRRISYAYIAGAALWIAWLMSCIFGTGSMDLAGQVVGTDYLQFYAAGTTLRSAAEAHLYDFAYQSELELAIAGSELTNFHAFITPPFLAWLYVPLSALPYIWSFVIWSVCGLIFLWFSIKLLSSAQPVKGILLALTWFPIFASVSFGQNSILSLFLLSLAYWLWIRDKRILAGFAASLLLYKPQLVLGIGLLWLLEWRTSWRSLLGLALGGATLAGLSFWLLPGASQAYLNLARSFLPNLIYAKQFPLWHLHSLRGFWILLFPGQTGLAEGLSLALSMVGVVAYILFWQKNRKENALLFAGAICLTIWITPHAMIYDWSILLVPALLLDKARPGSQQLWKPLFALIWLATFISGPLAYAQRQFLPVALQVSLPIFLFVCFLAYKELTKPPMEMNQVHNADGLKPKNEPGSQSFPGKDES